jgi:hypothetical protein
MLNLLGSAATSIGSALRKSPSADIVYVTPKGES